VRVQKRVVVVVRLGLGAALVLVGGVRGELAGDRAARLLLLRSRLGLASGLLFGRVRVRVRRIIVFAPFLLQRALGRAAAVAAALAALGGVLALVALAHREMRGVYVGSVRRCRLCPRGVATASDETLF
jgi:hypothetical protein